MKKYYVYIITNEVTGRQYVGEHYCNEKYNDNYFGGGIALAADKMLGFTVCSF